MGEGGHDTVLLAGVRGTRGERDQVLERYMQALAGAARSGGGAVLRRSRNELMAVFPAAEAAAEAASGMQAAAKTLAAEGEVAYAVRIALHSVPAGAHEPEALGDTVKLATQLLAQARNEQIVASATTAAALGEPFRDRMRPVPLGRRAAAAGAMEHCEIFWRGNRLRLRYGAKEVVRTRRDRKAVRIGRAPDSDIVLAAEVVSRRHCGIVRREEGFVLRDYSSNGTFVTEEGEPEVRLHHAERLLRGHGWISPGVPRTAGAETVEYFCT